MQIEYKNGEKKFRCLKRNKLVKATPEEEVRQQLLKSLINDQLIPLNMVNVEIRLAEYDIETNDRADIIIDYAVEEGLHPLILIECKRPDIPLTYKVYEQVERYNANLGAKIWGMTNGKNTDWFLFDDESSEYKPIEYLPTYQEILENQGFVYIKDSIYHDLNENDFIETPSMIRPLIANLYNLLNNTADLMPLLSDKGFKLIKDCGLVLESNGNSGGGNWEGYYRNILMNIGKSDNVKISFCLFHDEPYLACAFHDNVSSHNSLQLKLNDWIRINRNKAEFWHDGTITIGRFGRAKSSDMIDFVAGKYPELIMNDMIFLGDLDISKKLSFRDSDVTTFLTNLIKYVLCREEFRTEFKKIKANE